MERLEFIPSSAYWVTESGWSRKLYAGRRVRTRGSAGSGLEGNQGWGACAKVDFLGGESLARGKDWEQRSGDFEES